MTDTTPAARFHIRQIMRVHKVTIRELAARMDITIKRVRRVREHGLTEPHVIRDWVEAITGRDPDAIA